MRTQRGASALFTVLVLLVVGGLLALVLNVGRLMVARTQLQAGCDAAALAAAAELDGTSAGMQRARAKAIDYAARHVTDRAMPIAVRAQDVTFGAWAGTPGGFSSISESAPASDLQRANAVRVTAGREASRGNALGLVFPGFSQGLRSVDVRAEAVARGGGACGGCSAPLVVTDCRLVTSAGLACGTQLTFTTSTTDDVGFTNLTPGKSSVSTTEIIAALAGGCRTVSAGDVLALGTGNNLNKQVIDAFNAWISKYGSLVTVPIVHAVSCPSKMASTATVVGFASFRLSGIKGTPKPTVTLTLDCTQGTTTSTGCGFFGTRAPAELVR